MFIRRSRNTCTLWAYPPCMAFNSDVCMKALTQKGPITMAIDIHNITGESAQKAFINRVISRSDQTHPNTDHNVIRTLVGQLLDHTLGDLDLLADMLHVDVEWLLTGHGWCPPVSHKYRH